jgi:hypothetical protein
MTSLLQRITFGGLVAGVLLSWGCQEISPTASSSDLFPIQPKTVELLLPFSVFGGTVQVLGGYGSPAQLGVGPIVSDLDGFESRAIFRWTNWPKRTTVLDTTGTNVPDSSLTFVGGKVVVFFDTITSQTDDPVRVQIGAVTQGWHSSTVSWLNQVDTVGDSRQWSVPGGGPVTVLGEGLVSHATGDSLVISVDSAQIAAWGDSTDTSRGMLVQVLDPGKRLDLNIARVRLDTRPSVKPDTIVQLEVFPREISYLYDPLPEPEPDALRIGGAPAWRTYIIINPVTEIPVGAEICAQVTCPFEVNSDRVNQAELILTTRASALAFQPTDTTRMDVRSVLVPDLLPKAPLGPALAGSQGQVMRPEFFSTQPGEKVFLPFTAFFRLLLNGQTATGEPAPSMLALLAVSEPSSLGFLSFEGAGSENGPMLRLVLTVSGTVELP